MATNGARVGGRHVKDGAHLKKKHLKSGADTDGPLLIVDSPSGSKSGARTSRFPQEPHQSQGLWALVLVVQG